MPPLQYHYLKRPYELVPLAAQEIPRATYFDKDDRPLPETADSKSIAYSVYEMRIKPGVQVPAASRIRGRCRRPLALSASEPQGRRADLRAARFQADRHARSSIADDYVYQIKRLAHPRLHSPIFGLMSRVHRRARRVRATAEGAAKDLPADGYLDLNQFRAGGRQRGRSLYLSHQGEGQVSAVPVLAGDAVLRSDRRPRSDRFYAQPGMTKKNISLDWYPVGTGPYMLTVNNPNRQMVLERNPNFPGEPYPSEGEDRRRCRRDC